MEDHLWVMAAALDSGYLPYTNLIDWAQEQVLQLEAPPNWLLDLCISTTQEEAIGTLLMEWDRHTETFGHERPDPASHDDLYFGFLYLRFERGDLDLAELLLLAGRRADSYGGDFDCETFYLMLNEINGEGPTIPSRTPLKDRVARLLAKNVALARLHIEKLPSCSP